MEHIVKKVCGLFMLVFVAILLAVQIDVFAESHDVVVGAADIPVYSLDVAWGKMQFIYTGKKNYVWSSETHKYDLDMQYSWNANGNAIHIKNNSFMGVKTELTYVNNVDTLKGTFSKNNFMISSGKTDEAKFTLSGELSKNISRYTKVGTLTIRFS